jgi:polyribonucleotide nucleotidyltransferase
MGLVKEGNNGFAVLTDILGDEDHLGDMDFKVAGTLPKGVTALQMDIKIEGHHRGDHGGGAGAGAAARLHILGEMNKVIAKSRAEVSELAPSMKDQDRPRQDPRRHRQGRRGHPRHHRGDRRNDRHRDDGSVRIYAETKSALDAAIDRIRAITDEPEIGRIYTGIVVRIVDFGAFVNFMPGRDGLVHISQITDQRVESVGDYLKEGHEVQVKVLDVDNRGRIKLSIKEAAAGQD